MKLSIGMIVKNEEENLRKCLDAMGPILAQVGSELIIADTGSTDGTVGIAKEYTDQVFDYEWCDDFAAARNATLDRAHGEWYMAVDADEFFEDPAPIIDFFNSGEYEEYKSAMYTVRNYSTPEMDTYSDFNAARLVRLTKDTRYVHPVHEALRPWEGPTKILPAVADHTGYIWNDRAYVSQKADRNLPIMLAMLEKDPEDARNLMAISQAYGMKHDYNAAIQYAKRGLKHTEKQGRYIQYSLFSGLVACYLNQNRYRDALDTIDAYFQTKKETLATDLEMYFCRFLCLHKMGNYRAAADAGEAYIRIYGEYHRGLHHTQESVFCQIRNADPKSYQTLTDQLAVTYFMAYGYEKAMEKTINIPDAAGNIEVAKAFDRMNRAGDFTPLASLYGGLDEPQREALQIIAEKAFDDPPYRDKILSAFSGRDPESDYPLLLSLRYCHEKGTLRKEKLLVFIEQAESWKPLYADAVYFALKYRTGLGLLAGKINGEDLNKYLIGSPYLHFADLPEAILGLCEDQDAWAGEDARTQYWLCLLFHWALLTQRFSGESGMLLFASFAGASRYYIDTVCKGDILAEEKIALLPRMFRLGYRTSQGMECLMEQDYAGCLRALRQVLAEEEGLAPVVRTYQEAIEEERAAGQENQSELADAVEALKENIRVLIREREYAQAAQVLDEYESICPGDESIGAFRKEIAEKAG